MTRFIRPVEWSLILLALTIMAGTLLALGYTHGVHVQRARDEAKCACSVSSWKAQNPKLASGVVELATACGTLASIR